MMGFKDYNYSHFTREVLREMEGAFTGPKPGERAPDFHGIDLDGETVRLSDYEGKKNVLLVFGSSTSPMTAGTIGGINELYDEFRGDDMEFLFVYVREAHPGEKIPAHLSMNQKFHGARLLRDEEDLKMPVVVDDLRGSIHRKYSKLPNPAFLIDKTGRVAFRCKWTQSDKLAPAIEELLRLQQTPGANQGVVAGGEDLSMPISYGLLFSYRALERGGEQSLNDFRESFGISERATMNASRPTKPLLENPGRVLAIVALTTTVLAGGLYAGFELRKRRLGMRRNPYRAYEKEEIRDTETGTDYGAVGI
jgi:peroxiredoxin